MIVESIVRKELVKQGAVGLVSMPSNTASCKCRSTEISFMDCPYKSEDEVENGDIRQIARGCSPFWEDEDGLIRFTRKKFWRKATAKELARKNKCVLE